MGTGTGSQRIHQVEQVAKVCRVVGERVALRLGTGVDVAHRAAGRGAVGQREFDLVGVLAVAGQPPTPNNPERGWPTFPNITMNEAVKRNDRFGASCGRARGTGVRSHGDRAVVLDMGASVAAQIHAIPLCKLKACPPVYVV